MSASTTIPEDSFQNLLMQFEAELKEATDPPAALEDLVQRYPRHEKSLRELADVIQMFRATPFQHAHPADQDLEDEPLPERFGPYKVVRRIGRGGMGVVYNAIEEPLGREVAIKTLRRHSLDERLLARFDRERRTLAQLHHTNIVPIYATGSEEDLLYFAMPYLDGASLGQIIKTARSHEISGNGLARSSFKDLVHEAHSLSQSTSGRYDRPGEITPAQAEGAQEAQGDLPASPGAHRLSQEYIHTAVEVMATVAEGVHHAHQSGFIHRDLKPGNIIVDGNGQAWVLDFGLAAVRSTASDPAKGPAAHAMPLPPSDGDLSLTDGALGTPGYCPKEQLLDPKAVDPRTDVWSLGVTLYELLTLKRAFPSKQAVLEGHVPDARSSIPELDADLAAVIRKAIQPDPEARYPSAQALAEDLRHWLKGEPVHARPAHTIRRFWMWAKRNKGWAAAIALAAMGLISICVGGVVFGNQHAMMAEAKAQSATSETRAAQAIAREAQTKERASANRLQLHAIERLIQSDHAAGWFDQGRALVRQVDREQDDRHLQAQASALLAGMDAKQLKSFSELPSTLAFDARGRLLIGLRKGGVQIWDPEQVEPRIIDSRSRPLLFANDRHGVALELTVDLLGDEPVSLILREVESQAVRRKYPIDPAELQSGYAFSLTADGAQFALVTRGNGEVAQTRLRVWSTEDGNLKREIPIPAGESTDVALAPDGSLAAVGYEDGRIAVWSLPAGELITMLQSDSVGIITLLFGPDPVRRSAQGEEVQPWLLAAGDHGGTVTVWDLNLEIPRSVCSGGSHDIYSLAFRPDGLTLAAGGRGHVKQWDIATGRLLLDVPGGAFVDAVAYSRDGRKLAIGFQPGFGAPGGVSVWELEDGRGLNELHGLRGRIDQVIFSPDGKRIAALAHDWKLGVWERESNRLLHVFAVPPGFLTDNAGLAFDSKGKRLAFTAGSAAVLWDLESGRELQTWKLPPGLVDDLVFLGDRLLSFRVETRDGKVPPTSGFDRTEHPRMGRIRDLTGAKPLEPIREIHDFNWHVYHAQVSPDGLHLVIEGLSGTKGAIKRICKLYDLPTGQELSDVPAELPSSADIASFRFDPLGKFMFHMVREQQSYSVLEIPSLKWVGTLEPGPRCLGPGGKLWLGSEYDNVLKASSIALYQRGRETPLFRLPAEITAGPSHCEFSRDGRFVGWSQRPGSVIVADLVEVQKRLAELGMGW